MLRNKIEAGTIMKKQKLPKLNQFSVASKLKECSSYPSSPLSLVKSVFNSSKNLFNCSKSPLELEISPEKVVSTNHTEERVSQRSRLMKNKALLNEMGFRAELDFKPINLCENQKETNKLYSIQVTDFWRKKEKEKFLKNQGFWEAYKEIMAEGNKSKLYYSKTFKSPVSPKVLDITTSRKVEKNNENSFNSSLMHKTLDIVQRSSENSVKSVESGEKLQKLEKLEVKCHKLASDTKKLKSSAEKFRSDITKKFDIEETPRKKISRYELSRIKSEVESLI